jgi:hypothetical protein
MWRIARILAAVIFASGFFAANEASAFGGGHGGGHGGGGFMADSRGVASTAGVSAAGVIAAPMWVGPVDGPIPITTATITVTIIPMITDMIIPIRRQRLQQPALIVRHPPRFACCAGRATLVRDAPAAERAV